MLLLLQNKGVIKLKEGVGFKPKSSTSPTIRRSSSSLRSMPLQSPRVLDDVDAAGINTYYATQARLDPVTGAILRENSKGALCQRHRGPHIRRTSRGVKTLLDSYHAPEVKEFVLI